QAALDVQHHVVALGGVQTDGRARAGDRELHLVAVAEDFGGRHDRPQLEGRQSAQAREALADLPFLERELGGIGDLLESASAAAPKIWAGRLYPLGRSLQHLFDHAATETAARLRDLHPETVPRHAAPHEHDVTVGPSDGITAEGEVVDDELQRIAALRLCHGGGHYKRGVLCWPAAGGREYHGGS